MAYLLDANVLISAKNLHYGFDFCPGFWDWIVKSHDQGLVRSIEKVGDEVRALGDELSEWAKLRGSAFFVPPDAADLPALVTVSDWATRQSYEPAAISTFFQTGDYYLVSQALAGRHTVVTHEVPSTSRKKIKIPDICIGLRIKCITPFEMLRSERARFVLEVSRVGTKEAGQRGLLPFSTQTSS